ncbi:hypothetical protein MX059_02935 [Streptococcus uberis]|nr:hypothetical protein [Streptococcus uberis]
MRFFQKLQLLKSKNSQLTLDILTNIVFYVMVVLFYLSGITLILMITSHDTIINLPIIKDRFYGLASIVLVRQVPSLVLGFALLICGRAIANRNARAFYPTLVFFDPYYLNHSKIALLKSNNGTIVALATVEKSHSENSLS